MYSTSFVDNSFKQQQSPLESPVKTSINFQYKRSSFLSSDQDFSSTTFKQPQHSPNNSTTTSTSFSSNDTDLKHLEKLKYDLSQITSRIEQNEITIHNLEKKNKELKEQKQNSKSKINDLISQRESLEEIVKTYINEMKVNSKHFRFEQKVISLTNDISLSLKDKLKEQIEHLFFELNIKYNEDNMNQIEKIIMLNYTIFNIQLANSSLDSQQIANNFFNSLSQELSELINSEMYSQVDINSNALSHFLKYFIKINSLNQQVENEMTFINKKYKEQKDNNKSLITDLTVRNIKNANKKEELTNAISDLNSKIENQLRYSNNTNRSNKNNQNNNCCFNNVNNNVNSNSISSFNHSFVNQASSKRNHYHKSCSVDNSNNNKLSTYSYITNNTSFSLTPIKKPINNPNDIDNSELVMIEGDYGATTVSNVSSSEHSHQNRSNSPFTRGEFANKITPVPIISKKNYRTKRNIIHNQQLHNNQLYHHHSVHSCSALKNMHSNNNSLMGSYSYNDSFYQADSFCYFKILSKNEHRFNPLSSNCNSSSPESLGYFKGFISINFNKNYLLLQPKIKVTNSSAFSTSTSSTSRKTEKTYGNINESFLNESNNLPPLKIQLHKINNTAVQSIVKDIIKIHRAYLKQSNTNRNGVLNINKLIQIKELNEIKMDSNDKIKSALCKYFPFCIVFNNFKERLEVIFTNYEDFRNWLNGLGMISNDNSSTYENCNYNNKTKRINGKRIEVTGLI